MHLAHQLPTRTLMPSSKQTTATTSPPTAGTTPPQVHAIQSTLQPLAPPCNPTWSTCNFVAYRSLRVLAKLTNDATYWGAGTIVSGATKDLKPLGENLVTFSSLPVSRWANLSNLTEIRQRNKPKEPPKAPKAAPFFLPINQGLQASQTQIITSIRPRQLPYHEPTVIWHSMNRPQSPRAYKAAPRRRFDAKQERTGSPFFSK